MLIDFLIIVVCEYKCGQKAISSEVINRKAVRSMTEYEEIWGITEEENDFSSVDFSKTVEEESEWILAELVLGYRKLSSVRAEVKGMREKKLSKETKDVLEKQLLELQLQYSEVLTATVGHLGKFISR